MNPTLEQLNRGIRLLHPISPRDKEVLQEWLDLHLADTLKLAFELAKEKEASK